MMAHVFFTRASKILSSLMAIGLTGFSFATQAQIISPQATEVKFSYQATFEAPLDADEESYDELMHLHASHIFGIFHSPELVTKFKIDPELSEGIGAPRSQMKFKLLASEISGQNFRITYKNSGKMILHNKVAKRLLKTGSLDLPLPVNPYEIYDPACTDEYYSGFSDYWYFYNPFRKGCEYLSAPPKAANVRIAITATEYKKMDQTPKLPYLRGNNGNGDLFSIYAIHGYAEENIADDPGRVNFKELNTYLLENGFTETREHQSRVIPMYVYRKDIRLDNGKKIQVEIKHLLVETSQSSKSKVFATFFKEAVENADVILYGGHSGLGGNLDISSLEEKAGAFQFNPKKKQVFFFDSCASYSYYLEHFRVEKTKAKIDIISNGLSSYFHTSNAVLTKLLDHLLTPQNSDPTWHDILSDMETPLDGATYLLNVGGI
ncbi:MAG: hypothetical protein A2622_10345 [Bdellovibrionales bacterium RIFCSPHIGHO2_01_FULL_40_29]|nr:MAG: hypothetical protein A2622_10345 [Bdellovibrionales bacterium RIFCSPHIGHO2_01_FULL_40_29]OFZ32359.1 MAG: hypothetical protein A3D17_12315 [Bdellovibrionales bacterium RIFCSPHIGHO2_02_FULL_40_15]